MRYTVGMPRIADRRVSLFQSSNLRFAGVVVGVAGIIILGALFFGFRDTGMIDVNGKISATDQSAMTNKVNLTNATNEPNGGLRPASLDEGAPLAPEAPVPEALPPETVATTTEGEVSTSTSNEVLEPLETPVEG
ncbi:MAG: hypothetical protein RLZZ234_580 [Candidatus Parcubacteria bacterium]|jgi:hypothetical protein